VGPPPAVSASAGRAQSPGLGLPGLGLRAPGRYQGLTRLYRCDPAISPGKPAPRPITWPPPLSGGLAARGKRAFRPSGWAAPWARGGAAPTAPSPPVWSRFGRHLDSW